MRRLPSAAALLLVLSSLSGCGDGSPGNAAAADTLRLPVDEYGRWGRSAQLTPELRVGSLDGPAHLNFGRVGDLAVGPDGTIYVVDHLVPIIRVFSPDGEYVGDIGRAGEGPGEYTSAAIRVTPAGELVVWDAVQTRVTVFDAGGELAGTTRVPLEQYGLSSFTIEKDGDVVVRVVDRTRRPRYLGNYGVMYLRMPMGGGAPDTIRAPLPDVRPYPVFRGVPTGMLLGFFHQTLHAYSPEGYLVTARNDRYGFDLGRKLRVERDWTPVPVAPAERREWQALADRREESTVIDGSGFARYEAPGTKPAFHSLEVDSEGRVWIEPYLEAEEDEARAAEADSPISWFQERVADVYAPDGRSVGRVHLPDALEIHYRRGDHVWGVVKGEFDEPYVVRYRIVGGDA